MHLGIEDKREGSKTRTRGGVQQELKTMPRPPSSSRIVAAVLLFCCGRWRCVVSLVLQCIFPPS